MNFYTSFAIRQQWLPPCVSNCIIFNFIVWSFLYHFPKMYCWELFNKYRNWAVNCLPQGYCHSECLAFTPFDGYLKKSSFYYITKRRGSCGRYVFGDILAYNMYKLSVNKVYLFIYLFNCENFNKHVVVSSQIDGASFVCPSAQYSLVI